MKNGSEGLVGVLERQGYKALTGEDEDGRIWMIQKRTGNIAIVRLEQGRATVVNRREVVKMSHVPPLVAKTLGLEQTIMAKAAKKTAKKEEKRQSGSGMMYDLLLENNTAQLTDEQLCAKVAGVYPDQPDWIKVRMAHRLRYHLNTGKWLPKHRREASTRILKYVKVPGFPQPIALDDTDYNVHGTVDTLERLQHVADTGAVVDKKLVNQLAEQKAEAKMEKLGTERKPKARVKAKKTKAVEATKPKAKKTKPVAATTA